MSTKYPIISSLTTVKQTADVMIKVLDEISAYPNHFDLRLTEIDYLHNLIDKYAKHMSDLIEAEKIQASIQREIKEDKYARWSENELQDQSYSKYWRAYYKAKDFHDECGDR